MGIIVTFLILGLIVYIHEYGHYFVMRRNGVHVLEFTIGFGPTLWERQLKSGTVFKLKPFLIGGYTMPVKPGEPDSVESKSGWVRFKIYMAGMVANAISAFIVYACVFYVRHLAPADYVIYARDWLHAPRILMPLAAAFIGSFGLWLATPPLLVMILAKGLKTFFAGVIGPIGIITMGSSMGHGTGETVPMLVIASYFFATISVALAGFNLLPIFPLDGGRIADLVLEKMLRGKAPIVQKLFRYAGGALLLLLFAAIIGMDLWRAFLHR